jgi:hypothetical protein
VPDRDGERLDRKIDRIADELPESAAGFLRWLREPSSRWVRVPIALLLIVGGILAFLPVLGVWMIPLGLLFLAQDVPFLQRPMLKADGCTVYFICLEEQLTAVPAGVKVHRVR